MPPCGYSCRLARETCRKDVVETSSGSRPPGASPDASPLCVQPSWRSLDTTLARWRRQRLHHPMLRLHVLGPVLFCTVLYRPALSIVLFFLGPGCWMVGSGPCMDSSSRPGNATTLS